MSDYIKRDDALKVVDAFIGTDPIVERIKLIPSADVAPVRHGRWIEDKIQNHVEKTYHCSECDCQAWGENEKTHYCPNCGARMDGEDKNCDTCKYYDKWWYAIVCDGCTKAHSNWERKDDE